LATLRELGREDYIQHNPYFETGFQGLFKMIALRPPRPADAPAIPPLEFVRVIAEGDLVMTLRRILPPERNLPPEKEMANIDIFRVQDGKVAEHWDYQERFPRGKEPPKNDNGRF
jgi:predicted SnoaL-like aldol condensation-catalyzing enzyme